MPPIPFPISHLRKSRQTRFDRFYISMSDIKIVPETLNPSSSLSSSQTQNRSDSGQFWTDSGKGWFLTSEGTTIPNRHRPTGSSLNLVSEQIIMKRSNHEFEEKENPGGPPFPSSPLLLVV